MNSDDPLTYAIIGAAMEVHGRLGHGFLEGVYQEALAIEFGLQSISYRREVPLAVRYRDQRIDCGFKADFVCFDEIIVELKALSALTSSDEAQLLNYLKASGLSRGLLINFGAKSLQWERRAWTHQKGPQK